MGRWLERYRAGDRVQVWTEMTRLGADLRETQGWVDAVEVGRETMRRARVNVERLVDFLQVNGYQFAAPDRIFTPPESDVSVQLDYLEESVGVLPLALRCWCEEVGQVNLAGRHPDWPYDSLDPLDDLFQ
ncbi:MAG: hypothetical protein DLM55_01900, partial [Acidimicrobiales bacterium]